MTTVSDSGKSQTGVSGSGDIDNERESVSVLSAPLGVLL